MIFEWSQFGPTLVKRMLLSWQITSATLYNRSKTSPGILTGPSEGVRLGSDSLWSAFEDGETEQWPQPSSWVAWFLSCWHDRPRNQTQPEQTRISLNWGWVRYFPTWWRDQAIFTCCAGQPLLRHHNQYHNHWYLQILTHTLLVLNQ